MTKWGICFVCMFYADSAHYWGNSFKSNLELFSENGTSDREIRM